MPSGARKRKASKKKGKNGEAQSSNNSRTSSSSSNSSSTHSQGLDDRESDSGEIEREEEVEIVDSGKGLSGEIAEITKEAKSEKIDALGVEFGAVDVLKETPVSVPGNGGLQDKQVAVDYGKGLSDEIIAEITKEAKSEKIDTLGVEFGAVDVPKETPVSSPSNGGLQDKQVAVDYGKGLSDEIIAEFTKEAKSEKIDTLGVDFGAVDVPKETPISSTSNAVFLPQEANVGLGSSVASDFVESKVIKNADLPLQNTDVNENFSSSLKGPRSEKTEGKIVSKDEDKSIVATPVDFKALETKKQLEEQLVTPAVTATTSVVEDVKNKEIQRRSIDQTLIGSNPLPVQRTSWIGCCGLFELFSGANR